MGGDSVREKLLDKFRDVSKERIQNLNKGLLTLEKNPGNESVITEVMREIHTIKGESRMMEFLEVSKLAHSVEDLLKALKDKGFVMRKETMDILFDSLDVMGVLIVGGAEGSSPTVDVEAVMNRLAAECEGVKKRGKGDGPRQAEGKKWAVQPDGVAVQDKTEIVRVKAKELDTLASLVGDIYFSHARSKILLQDIIGLQELFEGGKTNDLSLAQGKISRLYTIVKDRTMEMETSLGRLEDHVRQIRLLPFSTIFDPYPRAVRDLAKEHGKDIDLELSGGETLADKRLLEEIQTPLVHLIRNSVDHGIEMPDERRAKGKSSKGRIRLSAFHKGDRITLIVEDDGRGIDPKKIKRTAVAKNVITEEEAREMTDDKAVDLIFRSGFSTKEAVTETSGRGVGLDVVREKVKGVGGSIVIESTPDKSTQFILSLPVSLSIVTVLLVKVDQEVLAFQASSIETAIKIPREDVQIVEGMTTLRRGDRTIPCVALGDILGIQHDGGLSSAGREKMSVVILRNGDELLGCTVDEIRGEKEILIKPLGGYLANLHNVSGATVTEDGTVILLIHVPDLFVAFRSAYSIGRKEAVPEMQRSLKRKTILVVEDSLITREMERSLLESFGFDVEEAVDGQEALQKLASRSYDLVLTDLQMPNMDGFELTRRIRADAALRTIPVIVMTTLASHEDRTKGVEAGADAYITKADFTQKYLQDTIQRLLR